MWVYWILFSVPALIALHYLRSDARPSHRALSAFFFLLAILIGFRFNVGVDFGNYIEHYDLANGASFYEAVTTNDPAFGLLNMVSAKLGFYIWFVNLICAAIFSAGIFRMALLTPSPWMALAISIPQIVIVVGMGYTRQSAALGFVCFGLVAMHRKRVFQAATYMIAGALFHKSAVIMLFLGFLSFEPRQLGVGKFMKTAWRGLWLAAAIAVSYYLLLAETEGSLMASYIDERMISDGTYPRVLMNVCAAFAYFIAIRPRLSGASSGRQFWTAYAATAMPFVILIIFLPPLTAIDRVALYWMPLQIYVCGHLPAAVSRWGLRQFSGFAILLIYGVTQFVWFTYGNFSWAWKPYGFYPLEVWVKGTPF